MASSTPTSISILPFQNPFFSFLSPPTLSRSRRKPFTVIAGALKRSRRKRHNPQPEDMSVSVPMPASPHRRDKDEEPYLASRSRKCFFSFLHTDLVPPFTFWGIVEEKRRLLAICFCSQIKKGVKFSLQLLLASFDPSILVASSIIVSITDFYLLYFWPVFENIFLHI